MLFTNKSLTFSCVATRSDNAMSEDLLPKQEKVSDLPIT